ncbi:MAG TPA: hypothetical protein VKU94_06965 [Geobacterales bacterium]|nr:hypothetical protein [Geobacterales bacterium]
MIPIEILEKIGTYSALKVLIYLYKKSNNEGIIKISMNTIVNDSDIPRNSVIRGIEELLDKRIIELVAKGKGNDPNAYRVPKNSTPKIDSPKNSHTSHISSEWKKAVGSRADDNCIPKIDHTDNYIYNNINNIYNKNNINNNNKDFKDYNLYNKDINSLSVVNNNIYLSDKELGAIAKKLLDYWYKMVDNGEKRNAGFFANQMRILKDLLVKYRTEQVLAGIEYWTKINPPNKGMMSLVWLKYEKKGVSNMMIALDYYKQEYTKRQGEIEEKERLQMVEEIKKNALKLEQKRQEEKQKVDEMTDNDFLDSLLSSLGKLDLGGKQ